MIVTNNTAYTATACWLEKFVIGLNLCPFAAHPWNKGQVRIAISDGSTTDNLAHDFLAELRTLVETPASELATTLLVTPEGLQDFEDYLDFVELAQQLLEKAQLEGQIQLASFHPDYLFEGESSDSPSVYTNRSPYPLLHLIREAEMEEALSRYPDPENIPDNNIRKMNELGLETIHTMQNSCRKGES